MKKLLLIIVILAMGQALLSNFNKFPNVNTNLANQIALEEGLYNEADY